MNEGVVAEDRFALDRRHLPDVFSMGRWRPNSAGGADLAMVG